MPTYTISLLAFRNNFVNGLRDLLMTCWELVRPHPSPLVSTSIIPEMRHGLADVTRSDVGPSSFGHCLKLNLQLQKVR